MNLYCLCHCDMGMSVLQQVVLLGLITTYLQHLAQLMTETSLLMETLSVFSSPDTAFFCFSFYCSDCSFSVFSVGPSSPPHLNVGFAQARSLILLYLHLLPGDFIQCHGFKHSHICISDLGFSPKTLGLYIQLPA